MMLLISASRVARIVGMSYQHLAFSRPLVAEFQSTCPCGNVDRINDLGYQPLEVQHSGEESW
jgi:hypothetical protein